MGTPQAKASGGAARTGLDLLCLVHYAFGAKPYCQQHNSAGYWRNVDKKSALPVFQIVETLAPVVRRCGTACQKQLFKFFNDFRRIVSCIVHTGQMFHSEKHASSRKKGIIFLEGGDSLFHHRNVVNGNLAARNDECNY
jgi:hypothetical protein